MRLREWLNIFYPDETIGESKEKLNQLAKKNANYFVMTNFGENITEKQFSKSGRDDYINYIKEDKFFRELDLSTKCILEVGCGIGRIIEFVAQDFQEVYGIDISEEMIKQAEKRLVNKANIHLCATDGLYYPFPNDFFDTVFSFITFQHMPGRITVKKNLEEIARVLKKIGLAKIQFRGAPACKGSWFYGPSFKIRQINKMVERLPLQILKTEGEGTKYFWVWFRRT